MKGDALEGSQRLNVHNLYLSTPHHIQQVVFLCWELKKKKKLKEEAASS